MTNESNTATIVIASPYGPIAMTVDQFRDARSFADQLAIAPDYRDEHLIRIDQTQLVDAAEAARLLGVKATWLLQRAREHRLPHVRIGKYVRFDVDELRRSLQRDEAPAFVGVPK